MSSTQTADHSILNDQWKIHINLYKFATWREDLELVRLENSLCYKKNIAVSVNLVKITLMP